MDFLIVIGDFLHLLAVCALLVRLLAGRDAQGLSYRTQEMFLVVFLTRFSDMVLLDKPFSFYLMATRMALIGSSITIIWLLRLTPRSRVSSCLGRAMIEKGTRFRISGFIWQLRSSQFF